MHHINAAGIIFVSLTTKRMLFLMRNDRKFYGHWGLPGGKVDNNETLLDTIARECSEEIGQMPTYLKLAPVEKFTSNDKRFTFHTFVCVVVEEFIPVLNDEHIGYCWMNPHVFPKPLHPGLWSSIKSETILNKVNDMIQVFDHNHVTPVA